MKKLIPRGPAPAKSPTVFCVARLDGDSRVTMTEDATARQCIALSINGCVTHLSANAAKALAVTLNFYAEDVK